MSGAPLLRVAVIGSGISGLAVAHSLHGLANVTLFEAGSYFGGHTHTVDITLPTPADRSRTAWTPAFWCSTNAPIRA
jgi:predicted NAD/FAD-binding protein